MEIKTDFSHPYIDKEDIFKLDADSINNFYTEANDFDRMNLYFVLENSYNRMIKKGCNKEAAFLAFNLAYYLFILLTPPGSCDLAMHYIDKAIEMDKCALYYQWKVLIEEGN